MTKSDADRIRRFGLDAISIGVTIYVFLVLSTLYASTGLGWDEQFFVWSGWSVLKGMVPYRDFVEFKPPVAFLVHALALKIYGLEGNRFRDFFCILACTSVVSVQVALLSRRVNRVLAASLGVVIVSLFTNPKFHDSALSDTESIGMSFYLLGLGALLLNTRYRLWANIAGGFFFACCVLSKEPYAAIVVPTWIGVYFAIEGLTDWRKRLPYFVWSCAIGVGIVVVALCLWLVPTGGLKHYLITMNWYRKLFTNPQLSYCAQISGQAQPTILKEYLGIAWEKEKGLFFNVAMLGYLAPLSMFWIGYVPRKAPLVFVASLVALFGGFYSVSLGYCFWSHYYIMAQGGLFFALATGLLMASSDWERMPVFLRTVASAAIGIGILVHVWPRMETASFSTHYVRAASNRESIPGIRKLIHETTSQTDTILTTAGPALYVETNRRHALKLPTLLDEYLAVLPGNTDEEKLSPLRAELENSNPKVVVFEPDLVPNKRKQRHLDTVIRPYLRDHNYTKVGEYVYVRP